MISNLVGQASDSIYKHNKAIGVGVAFTAAVAIVALVIGLLAHFNNGHVGIFTLPSDISYALIGVGGGLGLVSLIAAAALRYQASKRLAARAFYVDIDETLRPPEVIQKVF